MKQKTVLVIEDNHLNMKLVRSLLQFAGYEVLEAPEAALGIQLAREARPDLILMDIQLPGMDGLTATQLLREDPDLEKVPIVALTAHAMAGDEAKIREAGCDGYLSKPIDTRIFVDQVASFMEGEGPAGSASSKSHKKYKSRILVVDDEPLNVKLMASKLSPENHEIILAYSGPEALEKARIAKPDVIILDIMMPDMDGFEVARRLKEDKRTDHIPIIMVTALDGSEYRVKALETGADEFLSKPVNTTELKARINSMLCLRHCKEQITIRKKCAESFDPAAHQLSEHPTDKDAPSILLVEDNAADARLILSNLQGEPYRFHHVRDGEEALALVRKTKIDLIVLDILLPGIDGYEVCRRLKEMEETSQIQVVVITCLEDLENRLKSIELGADEYLVKPIDTRELKARVKVLLKKKAYMDQLESSHRSALNSAIVDEVTGLYNHSYFKRFLTLEVKRAQAYQYPLALLLVDIGDRKPYEDPPGSLADDEEVKEAAEVIRTNFRETDLLARYGSHKFAVLLHYIDQTCAVQIAERISLSVRAHKSDRQKGEPEGELAVAMGIALCPADSGTPEELLLKAEERLYRAKGAVEKICVNDRVLTQE